MYRAPPRLKHAQVRLYKEGATFLLVACAEFGIMNGTYTHPNRLRVTPIKHANRVNYCSEECPTRTVIDRELAASTTRQKGISHFYYVLVAHGSNNHYIAFYVFYERIPCLALFS